MAISRELTKTYEETLRGTVGSLRDQAAEGLRGELTLVLAGATEVETAPEDHLGEVSALSTPVCAPRMRPGRWRRSSACRSATSMRPGSTESDAPDSRFGEAGSDHT